jgi:hypothetical protein
LTLYLPWLVLSAVAGACVALLFAALPLSLLTQLLFSPLLVLAVIVISALITKLYRWSAARPD